MRGSKSIQARLSESESLCSLDGQMYTRVSVGQGFFPLHLETTDRSSITRIAFMSGVIADSRQSGLPSIHDTFEDKEEPWIGYPLTTTPVPYRPTVYLLQRCRLAELFEEMHSLILTSGDKHNDTVRNFSGAVDGLAAKMQHWLRHLPTELEYNWPMCISVWELQLVTPTFAAVHTTTC